MRFCVLTLFPEMFRGFLDESVLARGQAAGAISITTKNIRDYSTDKHRRVDDTIFGGGPGMLLKPEPVAAAIRAAKTEMPEARVISLSPGGERFSQRKAEKLASSGQDLIFLSSRYEGVDQRIRATMIDEELSIGDYVLSGGEIAAAAVIDVVARLVPGVIGKIESTATESFSAKLFRSAEFPQFTRPEVWEGLSVPQVLRSGNHAEIEKWHLDHLPGLSDTERKIIRIRKNILPLKTRSLLLRNHEETDIDFWLRWVNDEEVTRFLTISPPLTREDEEDFYDASQEDLMKLPISICDKKTKNPIGTAELRINPLNHDSAGFGIMIGEKSYWGKGVCVETLRELLKIGFEELCLERIQLDVFAQNIPAQKCYEKCGLTQIGHARKKYRKPEDFHDAYFYEILREDFFKKHDRP